MMILKNSPSKSQIPGFYNLSLQERQEIIKTLSGLSEDEIIHLKNWGNLGSELGNKSSENVIGGITLPFSIATNFQVNSKDFLIPMVTEEASVVAAASKGAKIARKNGGFFCDPVKNIVTGQVQILPQKEEDIEQIISSQKEKLLEEINSHHTTLISVGGGAKDISIRNIITSRGEMVILHVEVDVVDAMGANIVNTMMENLGLLLQNLLESQIRTKIISNLPTQRLSSCTAVFDKDMLGGEMIVNRILDLCAFAEADPYRAVTHNKGIMNGITALSLSTGNDTRAIEAGVHAYASMNGKYKPLSKFSTDDDGNLIGKLVLPLSLGVVGGFTNVHPVCKIALKILDITSASELIQIAGAVGLAQNISALRALADEGIQRSHMKLHKRKLD